MFGLRVQHYFKHYAKEVQSYFEARCFLPEKNPNQNPSNIIFELELFI